MSRSTLCLRCVAAAACALPHLAGQSLWAAQQEQRVSPATASQSSVAKAAPADKDSSIFRSLFDPLQAPTRKSMGLLQSNFLDALDRAQPKLQVAWVLDGTTSMKSSWEGLRDALPDLIGDLQSRHGQQASFAMVVFRDSGAKAGKVSVALPDFNPDGARLVSAIKNIQLESGAPYFPEPVDLAVQRALELPWDPAADTTKWIILASDAPPYGEGLEDARLGAVREVSNEMLVESARSKGVNILSLLCRSDPADFPAFTSVLDRTRRFMTALADGTGGIMLDTSVDQVREVLSNRSQALKPPTQSIDLISWDDVAEATSSSPKKVRVAVLPHADWKSMNFDLSQPAGRVALELQQKLAQVPGLEVVSALSVENAIQSLAGRQENSALDQLVVNRAMAAALDVDYLIWGRVDRQGSKVIAKSGVFDGNSGELLAQSDVNLDDQGGEKPSLVILASTFSSAGYVPRLASPDETLKSFLDTMGKHRDVMTMVVSSNEQVQKLLLGAYHDLEATTAFSTGDPDVLPLLRSVQRQLQDALAIEPNHAWGQYLLANCLYNQAQLSSASPHNKDVADRQLREMKLALNRAYENKLALPPMVRAQIEADHALLVEKNYADAIERYTKLAADRETPEELQRVATWMLMGLHLGDWGSTARDPARARELAIQVLARWPDSPEGQFLKRVLRWRQDRGALFASIPLLNQIAAAQ